VKVWLGWDCEDRAGWAGFLIVTLPMLASAVFWIGVAVYFLVDLIA